MKSDVSPDGVAGHHGLTLNLARVFPQYTPSEGSEAAWKQIVRDHAKSDRTVLISSEEFSRGRAAFRVDMVRLSQIASAFDRVTVVCCLREQVSFLQATFQEVSRNRPQLKPAFILNGALNRNDAAGLWVDWRPLYEHLLSGFSPSQLHFLDYHQACRREGGVIGTVLALGNITYRPASDGHAFNQSPAPLAYLMAMGMNAPEHHKSEIIARLDGALKRRFGDARPTCLWTRDQVAQIRAHFEAPNAELVARIQQIQPDFTLSLPKLPDDMLYFDDVEPVQEEILADAGLATPGNDSRC